VLYRQRRRRGHLLIQVPFSSVLQPVLLVLLIYLLPRPRNALDPLKEELRPLRRNHPKVLLQLLREPLEEVGPAEVVDLALCLAEGCVANLIVVIQLLHQLLEKDTLEAVWVEVRLLSGRIAKRAKLQEALLSNPLTGMLNLEEKLILASLSDVKDRGVALDHGLYIGWTHASQTQIPLTRQ